MSKKTDNPRLGCVQISWNAMSDNASHFTDHSTVCSKLIQTENKETTKVLHYSPFVLWVHHKRDNMIWEMNPFHGFRKIYNVPHQQPTVCPPRLSHQLWSVCILSSNGYTVHVFSKFFILKSVPSSPAEASSQSLSSKTPYVFQRHGVSYCNTPSQKPIIDQIAGKQLN